MDKVNDKQLPLTSYIQALPVLTHYTRIVLTSYDKTSSETRDTIIMNFMARSITSLRGILQLWQTQDFHDCWVLYRAILDRLFHLETLSKDDSFEAFDNWCFKNAYEYKIRCLNDPVAVKKITEENIEYFTPSQEDKERYNELDQEKIIWKRPRARKVATKMQLDFFYHYGYNFASKFVHPTSKEGLEDRSRLTGTPLDKSYDDQITVIGNSFLVMHAILLQGLIFSQLLWASPVMQFLEEFAEFLSEGSNKYLRTMSVLFQMERRGLALCKKRPKQD
ncbi:DUF5677 domain-containing protein [Bacteroidota bacterium]